MFSKRFNELLEEKSLSAYSVAKGTGISQGLMSDYKKGVKTPGANNLQKIANYLDVPLDYLMGNTDDINQKPGETNIKFDEFEFAMHNETKDLSDDDKNMLLDMARILKNRVIEKNKSKN